MFQFQTIANLIAGIDSLQQLGDECKRLKIQHVLLVTDQGIIQQQLHHAITAQLKKHHISFAIYQDVQADPPQHVVEQAIMFAKQHKIDGVIGLGGGSSLDVAKLIALLAHPQQQQSIQDIYGIDQAQPPRLPLIQIPTTAGTGSEVTPIAIVTTGDTTKSGVVSPVLYADSAILDARLTVNLPAHITAATGIDAMVHAIEAFSSKQKKNPYSDMLAKQALYTLNQALPIVLSEPQNLAARQEMLFGSMLAGQAFANAPVAAVHALAYPLGGHCHLSHGHANAILLAEVLKFNLSHATAHYAELMQHLNPQLKGTDSILAQQFIRHIERVCQSSGLTLKLAELNISSTLLPVLASDAMQQTRLLMNNPREVTEADALAIYEAIYS
ncbi:MAG: iron-containing alcohol dehydrogenase [Acinetobacter populi]|jgi:alcohol dehydrogenase|uniref:iron-containing alcohol dehydrogenase n=1 Tax=Acinetobacter populi TaxID=1582270 RepID=UPI00235339D3|nr:iron-containing alcohol dehydrogenase [Acinetobacter populi]MCH4248183.1 iron-containing alcohol dehydrogenase [Acinetobacter populi]